MLIHGWNAKLAARIERLEDEARDHGDLAQVLICKIALGDVEDKIMDQQQAWDECLRVLCDAEAQHD